MLHPLRQTAASFDGQIKQTEAQVKAAQEKLAQLKEARAALQPGLDALPPEEKPAAKKPAKTVSKS